MQKILIIEDEPAILLGLKDEFSQQYQTFTAAEGKQGLEIDFQSQIFSLFLRIQENQIYVCFLNKLFL